MRNDNGCPRCGAAGENARFCTTCGAPLTEPTESGRPRRTAGLIAGLVVVLVAAGAGGAFALSRSGADASDSSASAIESAAPSSATGAASAAEPAPAATSTAPVALPLIPTVIVLDASGSMNNEDAPGPRIDAAKNAVRTLIDGLPDGSPVGLVVYGTSTDSSDEAKTAGCQDIKTLAPVGPVDRSAFTAALDGVVASGYTPLGASLRAAASELPAGGPRTVIVVSDGDDTCQPPEPCAAAREVGGAGLTIHTVGFRVSGSARDALTCIAQTTGGHYVDAANAAQLTAFLRTAVDPNVTVNTLTHGGFGDLTIGMSVEAARSVDPSIGPAGTGTVVIVWRDCDLTFSDGVLVAIEPHAGSSTQDGLAVGDDAAKAGQLYGSSVVQREPDRTHAVFAVEPDSDVGYDVTFTPSANGQLAGPITRIVLCRCRSAPSADASSVNADDYLKTAGRWWFRTPDDGWNCSIGTQVFCESRYYSGNRASTYPPPTAADSDAADCGEVRLAGGMAVVTATSAQYGLCGHGEASEFVYDVDKGTVGLGKILSDGEVLQAAGFRCFVTGFAVTCGPEPATGRGFTVDQNDYRIYPRDGALPKLGADSPTGSDVIGPDGFGQLKLGMTVDQARQADPSLTVTSSSAASCTSANTTDVESLAFNPDGKLAWIQPRGNAHTPEGLAPGQAGDTAFDLYRPGEPKLATINPSINYFPVSPGSQVEYAVQIRPPADFDGSDGYDAARGIVGFIALDGGQRCFG